MSTQHTLLHDDCHLFAVVLHEMTHLPILAAIVYDHDIEADALVHAWAGSSPNECIDASGLTDTQTSLRRYPDGYQADICTMTPKQLLMIGEGVLPGPGFEERLGVALKYAKEVLEAINADDDLKFTFSEIAVEEIMEKLYGNPRYSTPSARR